ncbi:MAG: hypothetical protein B7Y99_00390 [Caulobacterales bacterium 32-69-10]|nr:MAG: hypothetical protein B7Y99_00390 [Caulobacterales bacterium 32-69-10]
MNARAYAALVFLCFSALVLGIRFSQFYIIIIMSLAAFSWITMLRAHTVVMKKTGWLSSATYVYGAGSFGVGAVLLSRGAMEATTLAKVWMFSGVASMGLCFLTLPALFSGSWLTPTSR